MAARDGPLNEALQRILANCAKVPAERDACLLGSGTSRWGGGAIAVHTDFGPAEQDKETNQDFVMAWVAEQQRRPSGILWALAMADGVTASYHAELGAELACRASLARLLAHPGPADAKARDAMNAAGDAIGAVADVITGDPEQYQPDGLFASTWKYTLREGLLLQTTLTLAWLEDGVCHLAIVGDGGAAIALGQGPQDERNVLAAPNVETSRVHAIGPGNRHVDELDTWKQVLAKDLSLLAIYTDGVGHGIGADASLLFEQLRQIPNVSQTANVAEQLIQEWIRTRAGDFDDNLSLAIVSWD